MKQYSKFYLPTMFQSCSKYKKNFCYMIQNHSSITLFIICVHVYKCLMNIYTKLYPPPMLQRSDMDPSLRIVKQELQITKSFKLTIFINCVYAFNKNTQAKFNFSACFQAQIESPCPHD